ncbi:hypothetical protein BC937DRAFT_87474 [Endogone sp. FLAS-F59071]|nr:hypothetical protein BC937DRAFT_87474 [Endogone sp. FLAS-F59071]|eukprot:RUS19439.1 hypothetical protein BC937DRAFT_87474 [Endogone sp. FLAS-F59071]
MRFHERFNFGGIEERRFSSQRTKTSNSRDSVSQCSQRCSCQDVRSRELIIISTLLNKWPEEIDDPCCHGLLLVCERSLSKGRTLNIITGDDSLNLRRLAAVNDASDFEDVRPTCASPPSFRPSAF